MSSPLRVYKSEQGAESVAEINIFREAQHLLRTKKRDDMTEQELQVVATAMTPLMLDPRYSNVTIGDGLEELAALLEARRKKGGRGCASPTPFVPG